MTGNNFSLFVMIGIILLLGMVGKNAILVVDFANQAIKEGKEVNAAILEAGEKRLRPILMTTFAMIGAMIPLAFGTGAGHYHECSHGTGDHRGIIEFNGLNPFGCFCYLPCHVSDGHVA